MRIMRALAFIAIAWLVATPALAQGISNLPREDTIIIGHKNVFFHYTPTSASWLNQVEIWFGIMSRKALRGASFKNTEELRAAIEAFVNAYSKTAKPFVWRKREVRGSQLRNTIANLCK